MNLPFTLQLDVALANAGTLWVWSSASAVEQAERRHELDVELQTLLWEWGVAEDAPEVLRLRREIEQLDRLETPSE